MKKLIILSVLCFFIKNAFAQAPKGTAALDKTGGWIFYDWSNSNKIMYNPLGSDDGFPKIVYFASSTPYSITPTLKEKLIQLKDIVKTAYPKPQGFSFLYKIDAIAKERKYDEPRSIVFACDPHGIENDGKGGLTTINIAQSQGNEKFAGARPPGYLGLFSVVINGMYGNGGGGGFGMYDFFNKLTAFDDLLKTKVIPNVSGVYMMPPKNNFDEAINPFSEKNVIPPSALIVNKADNYFVFRNLHNIEKNADGYYTGTIMNKIIITKNNKLPYQTLKRGVYLEILKQYYLAYNTKFNQTSEQSKKREQGELKIIEKLMEINENDLTKPATINPIYKDFYKGLSFFTTNKKGYEELQTDALKNFFIDDVDKGYTPCKKIKYYTGFKDEEWQTLMVNWIYEIPLTNNPKDQNHISNDQKSFYQAIKNNLDWDKLAGLLSK